MFFNWWDLAYPFRRYINRHISQCCRVYSYRELGITIASGWIIKNAISNNQKSLSDILPWLDIIIMNGEGCIKFHSFLVYPSRLGGGKIKEYF